MSASFDQELGVRQPYGGLSREICKLCYHPNPVGFDVPDDVWAAVVPSEYRNRVVCLPCFVRLADEKLIAWDTDIQFYPVSVATHRSAVNSSCM